MENGDIAEIERIAMDGAETLREKRIAAEKDSGLLDRRALDLAEDALRVEQEEKAKISKKYNILKWVNRGLAAGMFAMCLTAIFQRNNVIKKYNSLSNRDLANYTQLEGDLKDSIDSKHSPVKDYSIKVDGALLENGKSLDVKTQKIDFDLKLNYESTGMMGFSRVPYLVRILSDSTGKIISTKVTNLSDKVLTTAKNKSIEYHDLFALKDGVNGLTSKVCFPLKGHEKAIKAFYSDIYKTTTEFLTELKSVADSGNIYVTNPEGKNPAETKFGKEYVDISLPPCVQYSSKINVKNGKSKPRGQ
ncbi:MAG: hypothetical protein KKE23_02310 [Nanoarchaeota archaeon]|nr:hypothetical protein [Nanoarchaeota archaeon]